MPFGQAGLEKFVKKLPEGIDTQVGEHGAKLSGGQRQRIAIARALYRNAQILIFDEATNELDSQTERDIIAAIDQLSRENKTIFVIAHRFTTLQNCDRIYELKEGRVDRVYQCGELVEKELNHVAG
jgi:ABC-type bacteriocin/lantibiotic exporter with double-glycine peptidase domain